MDWTRRLRLQHLQLLVSLMETGNLSGTARPHTPPNRACRSGSRNWRRTSARRCSSVTPAACARRPTA